MGDNSNIEWTDSTFNPWEGCTKVGPGCDHCYAEARNNRFQGGNWGPGAPRRRTSAANWKKPVQWNAKPFYQCDDCGWRGDRPDMGENMTITKGLAACPECDSLQLSEARRRVFCASLADVFDNEVDPMWRLDLFKLIAATPNLDWLLLTKRVGNAKKMLGDYSAVPLPPNIWLGITVVNQAEADRDIPKLLAVPAKVRFLSMEPLLGPVDLGHWIEPIDHCEYCEAENDPQDEDVCPECGAENCLITTWGTAQANRYRLGERYSTPEGESDVDGTWPTINWVIVGGESGTGARPVHPYWVRSLQHQCKAAGVPFLFKQWGEWAPGNEGHGGDLFPIDRTKIESGFFDYCERFNACGPNPFRQTMDRLGKKKAGRLLDGRTWDEYPNQGSQQKTTTPPLSKVAER